MGWETRGNNQYFYRKEREGGRCVSTYLGNSETAVLLGEVDQARRAEQAALRAQERHRREAVEAGSKAVVEAGKHLRALVTAVLIANDFHQHKGQWRERMERERPYVGDAEYALAVPAQPDPEDMKCGLRALHEALRAKPVGTGKKGAITKQDEAQAEIDMRAAVRKVLDEYPCIWSEVQLFVTNPRTEMMRAGGCTSDSAPGMILDRTMRHIQNEFGYKTAPILEKLLIEQIALAWLDLHVVQVKYAGGTGGSHTLTSGAYWDRRLNGAQHRYLRAVEALARVRKLGLSAPLQVNIGGQNAVVAGWPW